MQYVDFDNYIFMIACLEVVQKTVKENENQATAREILRLTLECLKNKVDFLDENNLRFVEKI